jgi:hypothetical protein
MTQSLIRSRLGPYLRYVRRLRRLDRGGEPSLPCSLFQCTFVVAAEGLLFNPRGPGPRLVFLSLLYRTLTLTQLTDLLELGIPFHCGPVPSLAYA